MLNEQKINEEKSGRRETGSFLVWAVVVILNQLAEEAGMRKQHLGKHIMEVREESIEIWEEEFPSRGNSQCKGPGVGTSPGCSRAEEASM